MPPIKKYSKELIIVKSLEIVKKEGINSLNARRIAKELNSSIQPIFHNFKNMEELKECIYEEIYSLYKKCMLNINTKEKEYKVMGLNYIKFAKDYPEYFKVIFMRESQLDAKKFISSDAIGDEVIKKGQILTGFSVEEQKDFHVKVWIFTHGIASLIATGTIVLSEEEISDLLEKTVREMLVGYKMKGKE